VATSPTRDRDATPTPYTIVSANPSTLKYVMEITGRYKADFKPPNSLRSVLGFRNRVYRAGFNESENTVNNLTVNSVFLEVDIANGSYVNGKLSLIVYCFFQMFHLVSRLFRIRST
jgi:hypothetical protein